MQHDFTLAANGTQTIDVVGRFFKYVTGTGKIRVRATGGGYIDLLPGQGVSNQGFTSLTLQDRTGSTNAGTILAGDFDFRDERISGQVEVISGERARTLADRAFVGYGNGTADTGGKIHIQLWNPVGSGKVLMVEKVIISSTTEQPVRLSSSTAILPGTVALWTPQNKKIGSSVASVAQVRVKADQAGELGTPIYNCYVLAKTQQFISLTEPIAVMPGFGVQTVGGVITTDLPTNFEYYEEQLV